MTRSEHPSVGLRPVPNPDDAPNPEQAARVRDAKCFLDELLLLGPASPTFYMSMTLAYKVDRDLNYSLTPEAKHMYDMADYVEVVDKYVTKSGELGYIVVNLWYGDMTVRAMCHAPEALGVWTPPGQTEGTFTLMQRERLPLWAD